MAGTGCFKMRSMSHDPCVEGLSGELPIKSMTVMSWYAVEQGFNWPGIHVAPHLSILGDALTLHLVQYLCPRGEPFMW